MIEQKKLGAEITPVNDSSTHLVHYPIMALGTENLESQHGIEIRNQFGNTRVDILSSSDLLVPSLKDTVPIPSADLPDPFPLDHFKCYRVRLSKGEPPFQPFEVTLTDQFNGPAGKRFIVEEPTRLCVPVEKEVDGEVTEIQQPDDHLLCYGLSVKRGEPRNLPVRNMHVNNQFGPLQLDALKEKELCVPPPHEPIHVEILTDPDPPKQCPQFEGFTVNFAAVVTPAANITSYAWDFGDGGSSTAPNPSHLFLSGIHIVTLTVTDSLGRTASAQQAVVECSAGLVAFFEFAQRTGTLTVDFDASLSGGPNGVLSYRWIFGDGNTLVGAAAVSHTYATPGTYAVSLRIEDSPGNQALIIMLVGVTEP